MKKRPVRSIIDYLALSFFVSLAIILIMLFNGVKLFQFLTILGLSLVYVFWGIAHHHKENTLTTKIALEYVLFAIFGTLLVYGLL